MGIIDRKRTSYRIFFSETPTRCHATGGSARIGQRNNNNNQYQVARSARMVYGGKTGQQS
jgi:hypothetical protein